MCSSVETSSDLVERAVGERELADVGLHRLEPVDVTGREIRADELDSGAEECAEVRGLGEGVADLEDPSLRTQTRQHPRHLDDTLVGLRRRLEPADALAALSGAEPERDGVVELLHPVELARSSRARG